MTSDKNIALARGTYAKVAARLHHGWQKKDAELMCNAMRVLGLDPSPLDPPPLPDEVVEVADTLREGA